jgi:parallel beta-helix repeat protein
MKRRALLITLLLAALPLAAGSPARAATVAVPSSIDATGGADVTDALNAFIAKTPDGSTIAFPTGARYRVEGTLELVDRHNLIFDGHGARIVATSEGTRTRANWRIKGGGAITMQDLTIQGPNAQGGTSLEAGSALLEAQHAFTVLGVDGLTIQRVAVSQIHGDFVNLADNNGPWTKNVMIRGCTFQRNGRQGISITAAENVVIEQNRISEVRRAIIDIEPNSAQGGALNVRIADNDIGPARLLFLASGGKPGRVEDISVIGNRFTNQIMRILVKPPAGSRRARFSIINNVRIDNEPISQVPMTFHNTDGVVVRGNRQAFKSGREPVYGVRMVNSCNAVVRGNDFEGSSGQVVEEGTCPAAGAGVTPGTPVGGATPGTRKSPGTTEVALPPGATTGPSLWVLGVLGSVAAGAALVMAASRRRKRRRRRRHRSLPSRTDPDTWTQ